jgi:hypothetical protein
MVTLTIKQDFKGVQNQLNGLQFKVQQKVVSAALNKVGAKAKTEMTRAITSEFNIKADEVRSTLRISKAKRNIANWVVVLDPFALSRRGRSFNLIRFVERSVTLAEGRRRAKQGIQNQLQFQIKKARGRVRVGGAFIATNKRTGGTAVFRRTGNARFPIEAVQTIDVKQMFNTKRINQRVLQVIRRELPIEFNRAIKAALSGNI